MVNCSKPLADSGTDFEQLYALKNSNEYKDSLAQALQPSYKYAMTLTNTEENRKYMDSVLMGLRWTRDSVSFLSLANLAQKYAIAKKDDYALAKVYNNKGMYYHDVEKLDSTFYYYLLVENIYKNYNDSIRIGECEFYQARLLYEMGLFMESEAKVSNALLLLHNYSNNAIPFEANQLMALNLMARKDYVEAERYFIQAINLMKKDNNKGNVLDGEFLKIALAAANGNLAGVLYMQGKYQESKDYAEFALNSVTEGGYPLLVSYIKTVKATADFQLTGDERAFEIIKANYKIDSTLNDTHRMFMTAMELAELYLNGGYKEQGIQWGRKAYNLVQDNDYQPMQRDALEFLVLNEDHKMRSEVTKLIHLNRALEERDNTTRNRFARIAYETNIIEAENDHLRGVISMTRIIAIPILFIIIILFYIFRLRSKNRALKLIQAQKQSNESIYQLIIEKNTITTQVKKAERNRIAKDLHDGVVNGIFTIRFNLQQLDCDNIALKKVLIEELQKLEGSTRDLSHSLRDIELFKENKFSDLIEDLFRLQRNAWNTEFIIKGKNDVNIEALTSSDKVNIYYILTEAIQNVNKHSQATKCILSFSQVKNRVVFNICDNGVGIGNVKGEGIGMSNMKERASFLKSSLDISTPIGGGTSITFSVKVSSN